MRCMSKIFLVLDVMMRWIMNNLVNAIFGVLNAVAVKNGCVGEQAQPWISNKDNFLQELASVLEYGVQGTNFSWFWLTKAILKDSQVLSLSEFDEIVNEYQGNLNFALYLGADDDLMSYLDDKSYNDFVEFHNYFWETVAYETVGQGV